MAGTDGTVSVQLPGPFPGRIAHLDAGGEVRVVEGTLAADAPLRFLREDGKMRAVSFDESVAYEAHERVVAAAPWSAEPAGGGCCGWWENTLWRAAPGKLNAGLLRAVTPPLRDWSVLDWHLPSRLEPAWRIQLTEGATGVVAAAVSPEADQLVVVLSDASGASSLRALATRDGQTAWTAALDGPAAEWRRGGGRLSYSADGARVAVLVEDRARCESCTALEVFDTRAGERLHRVSLQAVVAPRFTSIGLTGDAAWAFEHVPPKRTDMSTRPERCQYEVHDLAKGTRRTLDQTAAAWGMKSCTTWALLPRFGQAGVVGLGTSTAGKLVVLAADHAP